MTAEIDGLTCVLAHRAPVCADFWTKLFDKTLEERSKELLRRREEAMIKESRGCMDEVEKWGGWYG
jgi:hypothetical protein